MGGNNSGTNRRRRGAAGAFLIGSLVVLALVCIGGDGHQQRRLSGVKKKAKMAGQKPRPATMRKMAGSTNAKATHNVNMNKKHASLSATAVHSWMTNHASDADGKTTQTTERALKYRPCPPGVDSVTGSFCGLSYEQICCFCPQPADCEAGCPADGDGVVRDGCFHHVTIPCPDVDCDVDAMVAEFNEHRPVEVGDR